MSLFAPRHESAGESTDIGFRALRLIDSIQLKLSQFESAPVTAADVIFGRCNARLVELPVADLEATLVRLERHVEKNGCSVVRCFNEDHRLSDVLQQLRSTLEQLKPYRVHIPKP